MTHKEYGLLTLTNPNSLVPEGVLIGEFVQTSKTCS